MPVTYTCGVLWHTRTLIADLLQVLQAVTNVVGGILGELTAGVQLSWPVAN
jgi:hypothetical protein